MRTSQSTSFLHRRPVQIVLSILALGMAWHTLRSYLLWRGALGEEENITRTIEERTKNIEDLEKKLESFKSGEGLELEARSRLNLKKPGEEVLIIVDSKARPATEASSTKENIFLRVVHWFRERF